jgi:hypothetical protein
MSISDVFPEGFSGNIVVGNVLCLLVNVILFRALEISKYVCSNLTYVAIDSHQYYNQQFNALALRVAVYSRRCAQWLNFTVLSWTMLCTGA